MNTLFSCLLLLLHSLVVDKDSAGFGYRVCLELRSGTLLIQSSSRVRFLHHLLLVSIPEWKGSLALLSDLYALHLYFLSAPFVSRNDLLVAWLQHCSWDRLASEGVADLFFNPLLLDHFVDFLAANRFWPHPVLNVKLERFWHSYAIFTFLVVSPRRG